MILAIDIGNTNTVFAVIDGTQFKNDWRCKTIAERSADEYASFLKELFSDSSLTWGDIKDIIISSVVPDANMHIGQFCEKYIKQSPVFITKDNVGIGIDLNKPDEVGADRLVNAAAVIKHYQTPAIVVDFGTATTFDVIDEQGRYAGGAIAPGINLSLAALEKAAAKLPSVKVEKPESVVGKDTVSAMQSGLYYGYKGLIAGLIKGISDEMGAKPFVIATGGLAGLFADNMPEIEAVDQSLTIKGLLEIHKHLQK